MQILLIQNVEKLGQKGETKNVSDGYARNFLLAKGLAVKFNSKEAKNWLEKFKSQAGQKIKKNVPVSDVVGRLKNITLDFCEKADENGTFFAGITKEKIAKALMAKKLNIKAKNIDLPEPIKTAGTFKVKINIDANHLVEIKVITNNIK